MRFKWYLCHFSLHTCNYKYNFTLLNKEDNASKEIKWFVKIISCFDFCFIFLWIYEDNFLQYLNYLIKILNYWNICWFYDRNLNNLIKKVINYNTIHIFGKLLNNRWIFNGEKLIKLNPNSKINKRSDYYEIDSYLIQCTMIKQNKLTRDGISNPILNHWNIWTE